jgi:hypothetical protein
VTPFTALIPASGAMLVAGFVLFLLALIAEMVTVHRGLSEELLYLARQRLYARKRAAGVMATRKSIGPDQAPWQASPPGTQGASHDATAARAVASAAAAASASPRSTAATTDSTSTSPMHHGGLHLTEG